MARDSPVTLQVGRSIVHVLKDDESIHNPFKGGKVLHPRALADKLKTLFKKLFQEAENEADYIEKVTVATMRSMLHKELKTYIDPMEITTLQHYLIKIGE